ncbi:DNA replication licensing factor Mcm6-like [Rhipicephalus sanguineus]|uniref:Uncharacterized protein n=1 Tax=Rhipicephalus sanguineus TaxID=34632 RepID=A0A9D4YRG2_RHISA|nr:DNA replication licensing factor Mcm6-like [Rhipicephalus sanguineus]KAH7985758.1 hypothetical protein HPB52_025417 [Rhipicephalus sanguineus]
MRQKEEKTHKTPWKLTSHLSTACGDAPGDGDDVNDIGVIQPKQKKEESVKKAHLTAAQQKALTLSYEDYKRTANLLVLHLLREESRMEAAEQEGAAADD